MDPRNDFFKTYVPKTLLVANIAMAILYFYVIAFYFPIGNIVLFTLLVAGEVFHVWQVVTYAHTVWNTEHVPYQDSNITPRVDVFITVAGEPIEIIQETVSAAKRMDYPRFRVHILNDGYVANKDNWKEVEMFAAEAGVNCITRKTAGGAKAGNINNGLSQTTNPLVVVFDADHVPHRDFLAKTVPYFADPDMGFVQTPQYYKNHTKNTITRSAWEQQEVFFGPICKGKNRINSATMCGTNMVIRREALEEVGGMSTESIAEDFLTGMLIHERGWKSLYIPEVLAEGLSTEDFLSYYKQQFRWARGALDVIFRYNPLFRGGLTFAQKIQYLSSASFFLSGVIIVVDALLPVIFFFTGSIALEVSTMALAAVFLPYIFLTIYTLQYSTNFSFTFSSLAFSKGGISIQYKALISALSGKKATFSITSKEQLSGNFLPLVIPHIIYVLLVVVGLSFALYRDGLTPSVMNNAAWAFFNVGIFLPFIYAASPFANKEAIQQAESAPAATSEAQKHSFETTA